MENNNLKKVDYTGGDHSFKKWFSIMWKNLYIQLFVVFITLLILQILNISWCIEAWYESLNEGIMPIIMVSMGMLIPISGTLIIAYKSFYQFWNDLKNGTSR